MATHSSILAWRIPWTEKPGELQSMGSQRVGHDGVTHTHTHTHIMVIILSLTKVKCSISFLDQLIIIFYQLWDARCILQRQWGALGT